MDQETRYWSQHVEVKPDVAAFFEEERKRKQNQERSDERHLVFVGAAESEEGWDGSDPVFEEVCRRLQHQKLMKVLDSLPDEDLELIAQYFFQELSMQEIADLKDVSKTAISKRLKNLLQRMRGLMET